jgi:hypothetical protein
MTSGCWLTLAGKGRFCTCGVFPHTENNNSTHCYAVLQGKYLKTFWEQAYIKRREIIHKFAESKFLDLLVLHFIWRYGDLTVDGCKGNIYCTKHGLRHEWEKHMERDRQRTGKHQKCELPQNTAPWKVYMMMSIINLLTPWSTVLGKLTSSQLVMKFPAL